MIFNAGKGWDELVVGAIKRPQSLIPEVALGQTSVAMTNSINKYNAV